MHLKVLEPIASFFSRHWRGKARLWSAYWVVGAFGKLAVAATIFGAYATAGARAAPGTQGDIFLGVIAFVLVLGWFVFAAVSIWRCADNVRWEPWGYIARGVVVLGGFSLLTNIFQFAADMHA